MQKCQYRNKDYYYIIKTIIRLPLISQVWDVLAPQGDLRLKNSTKQNVFRISFYAKTPISQFCI
jgi:hypothetical protein